MTIPARISLVTLGVADLARSTRFYQALGWQLSSVSNSEVSFFHMAGCVFALYPFTSLALDAGTEAGVQPNVGSVALAINVESESAVESVIADAVGVGATVAKAAAKTDWGGFSGYFADLDGHLWEIAHNPGFPLDEKGLVILPK